jgi:hypothetical protein
VFQSIRKRNKRRRQKRRGKDQFVGPHGYPANKVHFVPGMVEDTIPAQAPERIALLRLDTDWYESISIARR